MSKGLYSKYIVTRKDGKPAEGIYFVLKPESDRFARLAVLTYAEACADSSPELSRDLFALLDLINPNLFEEEVND